MKTKQITIIIITIITLLAGCAAVIIDDVGGEHILYRSVRFTATLAAYPPPVVIATVGYPAPAGYPPPVATEPVSYYPPPATATPRPIPTPPVEPTMSVGG